jgi:hypothetical protein
LGDDFYDAPPAAKPYKKARFFVRVSVLDICAEVNYCFFPLARFSDIWKNRKSRKYERDDGTNKGSFLNTRFQYVDRLLKSGNFASRRIFGLYTGKSP